MKPEFALNLTHENIGLLHRTPSGWLEVGVAALDLSDLGEALSYLRRSALGLSPSGFATKLIIPNSQILYETVVAPGPDNRSRRAQIRKALDGRTPYAVEDLVYDWSVVGDEVRVAVVARETLDEAEQFAAQHRFNPVSCVAIPESGSFKGEPWFGPTRHAADTLNKGETVERDKQAVAIIGRERAVTVPPPAASGAPAEVSAEVSADMPAEVSAELPATPLEDAVAAGAVPDAPSVAPETLPEFPAESGALDAALAASTLTDADVVPPPADQPAPELTTDSVAPSETVAAPVTDSMAASPPAPETALPPESAIAAIAAEGQLAPEPEPRIADHAPSDHTPPEDLSLDDLPFDLSPELAAIEDPLPETSSDPRQIEVDLLPGAPLPMSYAATDAARPAPTFSSRRQPASSGMPDDVGDAAAVPSQPAGAKVTLPGADAAGKITAEWPIPLTARLGASYKVGDKAVANPASALKVGADPSFPTGRRAQVSPALPDARKTPGATGMPKAAAGVVKPSPLRAARSKGKPRHLGLILTGILLLLLAAVAAVSSFYLASDDSAEPPATLRATAEPEPVTAPEATASAATEGEVDLTATVADAAVNRPTIPAEDVATPDDEALADLQVPQIAVDPTTAPSETAPRLAAVQPEAAGDATPVPDAGASPDAADPSATPKATDLTESSANSATGPETASGTAAPAAAEPGDAAAAKAAATATAAAEPEVAASDDTATAPPAREAQDEIFLSDADPPPQIGTPVVLPQPEVTPDPLPTLQSAPPPFGEQYQFDGEGRILATPGGVVTPDGITLVAGRPVKVPPPRPAAIANTVTPPAAAVVAVAPTAAVLPVPDAPSVPVTPTTPTTPVAAAVAAVATQAPATFEADPTLAGMQPRSRPEGVAPAAETAPTAAPAAGPTPATAPEAAVPDDASLAAPLPVDRALAGARPAARPGSIVDLATTARADTQAASLATDTGQGPLSPLAVALSPRPAPRPGNFAKAVEVAVAAAVRDAPLELAPASAAPAPAAAAAPAQQATLTVRRVEPTPAPEPTAFPSTEADEEPEIAAGRTSKPISGTVAKTATFANAFDMSKTGLIGTYVSSSNSFAMVRASNGRLKRYKVGDRIDGGIVAAITSSEMRYQKGGRMYALKVPSG